MSTKKKKRKIKYNRVIILILILVAIFTTIFYLGGKYLKKNLTMYVASEVYQASLYDEAGNFQEKITRGSSIITTSNVITIGDIQYQEIKLADRTLYINSNNVVKDIREVVLEKEVFVRTPTTILEDISTGKTVSLAKKGTTLEVVDYDELKEDGSVNAYLVKQEDNQGYIFGKYIAFTKDEAIKNYNAETLDPIFAKAKDLYGGGSAINLDYYPVDKPKFSDNVMPENIYALYLNNGTNVISNVDAYINFAKDTKINAFVIDIKDNQTPGYKSQVMEELSPTNYKYAHNSFEEYKQAIAKIKDAGFYVIGRITVFKDNYYVEDHPEDAILTNGTSDPYLHQSAYWPTPYSRDVWYFNVSLAKEAVKEMGFNEINFDYVRFPDRTQSVEKAGKIDYNNQYQEEKAQAIQGFLMYACDQLHQLNVYVSVDVFGESVNNNYVTAYGQYWPAISNIVDVISAMPYPDHFDAGNYNLPTPWTQPYELMLKWGTDASKRQSETPTPAIARTWIQSHNAVKSPYNSYGPTEVKSQIQGLYEAGLTGGYMTWLSNSNLDKYETQKEAFKIDYGGANGKNND
ncbi:MAG: putative glycoside hydrolase [bacterium]|nr:putative glycoside hydrolase [bacterium]